MHPPAVLTRAATISSVSRLGEGSTPAGSFAPTPTTSTPSGSTSGGGAIPPRLERRNSENSNQWSGSSSSQPPSSINIARGGGRSGISISALSSSPLPFQDQNLPEGKADFAMLSARGQQQSENRAREMEQLRNNARAAEFALRGQEEEMKAMRKRIGELEKINAQGRGGVDPRMEMAELQVNLRGQEAEIKEKTRMLAEKDRRIKDLEAKLCAANGIASSSGSQPKPRGEMEKQLALLEEKLRNKDADLRDLERVRGSERQLKERASQLAAKVHELEDQLRTRGIECRLPKEEADERSSSVMSLEVDRLKGEVATLKTKLETSEEEARKLSLRCTHLEDSLRTMTRKCEEVETARAAAEASRETAFGKMKEAEALLAKAKSGASQTTAEATKLSDQLRAAETMAEERGREVTRLTEVVADMTARTDAQQAQREKETADKDRAAAEFKAKMEEELRSARISAENCAEAATLADKSARAASERCAKAHEEHTVALGRIKELEALLEACGQERDEARGKANSVVGAAESAAHAGAQAAKRAQEEAAAAIAETRTYKENMARMAGELEGLKELLRLAEKGRDEALAEIAIHDKMGAQLKKELEAVHRTQEETEKQLTAMAASLKSRSDAASQDAEAKRKLGELSGRCEALDREVKAAQSSMQQREEEWAHEKAVYDTKAQIARLQTLLRMAEITKLEEILKATKRVEAVREELIGLLNYNLSAAEGQDLRSNADAVNKQVRTREERLEALHKKAKLEEERIKQAEQTYQTQSKRLKEKLRIIEDELQALVARKPGSAQQ